MGGEPAWQRCARHPDVYFHDFERARLHYENSCSDYWCSKCSKAFASYPARDQHFNYSSSHRFRCETCGFDGTGMTSLHGHWNSSGHRHLCEGCNVWFAPSAFNHHFSTENACTFCHRHFGSPNELRMHEITHQPATHKCYGKGCDRVFHTVSGMFIHLESGACRSTITATDVNAVFALHPLASTVLRGNGGQALLAFVAREQPPFESFQCFGADCADKFNRFSALLQHCESNACNAGFGEEASNILPFLKRNLYLESAISKIEILRGNIRKISIFSVGTDDDKIRDGMTGLYRLIYNIQSGLRDCLERFETTNVIHFDGTAEISYRPNPLQYPSTGQQIADLNIAVSEFKREYKAKRKEGGSESPGPIINVFFRATARYQTADTFMQEAKDVIHILRSEIS
ncbi:hypothetical protein TWF281_000671 [Arthrobotrys megalospora]